MTPQRIQLRRTPGWRMPANTLKVDRSTRWGNPFHVGDEGIPDGTTAVRLFRKLLERDDLGAHDELFVFTQERLRLDLGGKNLACWCRPADPCHADVLLQIANGGPA